MVQDRLNKALLRRLKELGLPSALLDFDEFRDRFFFQHWVMYVRDSNDVVDVHLVEPQTASKSSGRPSGHG
jgi:hypothetical protein